MYERFTDRARKVMHLANQEAKQLNHEYIGTEHILLGLVKEGSGVAANVLKNLDVDLRKVRLEVERIVQPGPDMDIEGKLPQTPRSKKVIEYSICEARNLNHNYIGTEHLLLGLLREQEGIAAQVLMNLGLRLDTVREEILDLIGHPLLSGEGRANLQSHLVEGLSKTPALDSFGRDLTELARAGTFAPLVGRSADIEKMLVVLTSMRSPCLLLIGERGVGKTALVNGLAGFIARGSLPSGLPQRVVALDLSTPSLRKGSKQDSERIIACLNEASRERVILSIEAAPLLFAEPKSVPTILFQARLRQGVLPIILSLTPAEYYLYIAPSSDKAEVFQALYLDSLSREDTLEILRQERPQYAAYHSVVIPETLLGRIAFLADRSLSGTLPGKAIQLLDYAAALARLRAETLPADVTQLKGGSEFDVKVDEQILNDALTMLKESANYINPDIVAGEDEIPF